MTQFSSMKLKTFVESVSKKEFFLYYLVRYVAVKSGTTAATLQSQGRGGVRVKLTWQAASGIDGGETLTSLSC